MKHEEKEFTEIISSLQKLKSIKPDKAFRNRMEYRFVPVSPLAMPFFALRVAAVVFVVLLSGTTVAAATKQSKPGDILYPVKQVAEQMTTTFSPRAEISQAPETNMQKPQQQNTVEQKAPLPTPTKIQNQQKQKENNGVRFAPTVTSTAAISPTPTPAQQSVLPAKSAQKAVDNVIENVPVHVNLKLGGSSQPTPTPQPKHEGSKDNGSNAGAGGSLLPKIKIGL